MKCLCTFLGLFLFCVSLSAQKTQREGFVLPEHHNFNCITIMEFQVALTKNGYPVKADNIWGKKTKKAFLKFAIDKGLPSGNVWGYFSEVFPALGFEPCSK